MKRAFEIRSIVSPKKSLPIRVTACLHGVVCSYYPAISGVHSYVLRYVRYPLLVVARPAVVFAFPVTSLKMKSSVRNRQEQNRRE
jgi:hypothetical protein